MKTELSKIFGKYVCDDATLKKYMPFWKYAKYKKIKEEGKALDSDVARAVAKAIKTWALKNGATHYTHWFMPLNSKTAEKQVAFLEIKNGKIIADFNEKSLIKGETDASSFPNGGMRMTFEARGYTVWDYTSPVFIKEDGAGNKVVYIPTAFCAYNGVALDEKTPLLRGLEALNKEAVRVLKILGYDNVKKVNLYTGVEQEYFLIREEDFEKRTDLKMLGRTLFGGKMLKSQEMCSHYFGMIDDKVSAFMNEVDHTLWSMGITAKQQHNEVAPSQFEFVPIYSLTNIAADQNQLIMRVIEQTAKKYGLVALFEEKPFENINGSGKHQNWSLSTDTGIELFDSENKDLNVFYTFFASIVTAIDKYNDLIKASASYRGNDLRLGGDEAPPAVVSIFASDYILNKIEKINEWEESGKDLKFMETGVKSLPTFVKDICDRNRTSPFAYSGNKFEFRMSGSSQSISFSATCVCAAMSKVLKDFADCAEKQENAKLALLKEVKDNFEKHKKVIFNGDAYSKEWRDEASKRGLIEYKNSIDVYRKLDSKDIVDAFEDVGVLTKEELLLRKTNLIKAYIDTTTLEAKVMLNMFYKEIKPAIEKYFKTGKALVTVKTNFDVMSKSVAMLEEVLMRIEKSKNKEKLITGILLDLIKVIRDCFDEIEGRLPKEFEPFPIYEHILR